MTRARIAISAVACDPSSPGGLNRYAAELVPALLDRGEELFGYVSSRSLKEKLGEAVQLVRLPLAKGNFRGNLLRLVWHQTALRRDLKRRGAGLFYSPVPDGMFAPPCPQVITVHDVLPLRFPEANPRLQHYYRHVLPRILRASAAIVTDSEATRRDLETFYDLPADRVHVIYPGYRREVFQPVSREAVEAAKARHGLSRFVLSVGETRPYKNIPRLVQAFAQLQDADVQLAVVGKLNRLETDLRALARSLGIEHRVKLLGYVPDEDLAALYSGAEAFAFPSLCEGFGIPPLEAMASGCPVVSSGAASLPEVCGDAALYIDPLDLDSIAAGLQRVLADDRLRLDLRQRGLRQATRFSYEAAADQILELVRSLAVCAADPIGAGAGAVARAR